MGRFGRGFIYDAGGTEQSADEMGIDTLATFGFIGFLAEFALLSLPVFAAAFALRFAELAKDQVFLSALALTLAINIFDLLPNSPLRPWTWLVAGALLGRAEVLRQWAPLPKKLGTVHLLPGRHAQPDPCHSLKVGLSVRQVIRQTSLSLFSTALRSCTNERPDAREYICWGPLRQLWGLELRFDPVDCADQGIQHAIKDASTSAGLSSFVEYRKIVPTVSYTGRIRTHRNQHIHDRRCRDRQISSQFYPSCPMAKNLIASMWA